MRPTTLLSARILSNYGFCMISVIAVPREFRSAINGARHGRILYDFLTGGVISAMGLIFIRSEDVSAIRLAYQFRVMAREFLSSSA